jgi:hypothetical protein
VRFKKSPTALTALTFLAVSLTVLWVIPVALLDDRWGNWVLFFIAPGWILLSFAGWLESRRAKRMHPVAAAA